MGKVIVLGPGPRTRGGITKVIQAYKSTYIWEKWKCKWISTYIDKNCVFKAAYFACGFFKFLIHLKSMDICHVHLSEPTSAFRKSLFVMFLRIFRKKIILHFHSFSPNTTVYGKKKLLYLKLFNCANAVIVLSKFWRHQVEPVVHDVSAVEVLYNPCPKVTLSKSFKKKEVILYAGTLNERKGYLDLIKAFAPIVSKHHKFELVFAGNGEIGKAYQVCCDLGIEDKVKFLGWVSGQKKEYIFSTSMIFCLPSYAEGFPMAVMDAWAYGMPVITTPVGGLPDVLEHNLNAMVFKPGDIGTLTNHLFALIRSREMRQQLSEQSLKLSKKTFNLDILASKLDNIYSRVFRNMV